MDNLNSLARKAAWSAVASICTLFGRLIAQIMIARMLGADSVGRIAYILWLIEIVNIVCSLGLPNCLTRYVAELSGQNKYEQANRITQWIFIRYLILMIAGMVIVGGVFLHSLQYESHELELLVLIAFFIARGLQTINQAYLAGQQRFNTLARINVVSMISLVAGVFLGGYFYSTTGVIMGYIVGALPPTIYSFSLLRGFRCRHIIDYNLRRRVWKFTIQTWFSMIVSAFIWSRMEIFFLERYWNIREVAIFSIGLTFAIMVRQVAILFSGSLIAHFSELVGREKHSSIQLHYEISTKFAAFIVIPMAFGGAAIMPALLPVLYGVEFAPAVPNAMVLTAATSISFSSIGSSLIYAKERSGFIALNGFCGAVLSVLAGFVIISHFGVWGAVLSKVFVQILMFGIGIWFIINRLHFMFPFNSVGRIVFAAIPCSFVAWSTICLAPNPFLAIGLAIPLSLITYLFCVKIFCVFSPSDIVQFEIFISHMPVMVRRLLSAVLYVLVDTK